MIYTQRLKEFREENKILQKDIADILKIERGLYSQYETEYVIMPLKHIITICDFYKISLDYLFNLVNKNNYNNYKTTSSIEAGLRLKTFRKENKITQEYLAKELNTNRSVIANYERGRTYIATPFLYTICKKYKISADYLLGRIDNPKYLK